MTSLALQDEPAIKTLADFWTAAGLPRVHEFGSKVQLWKPPYKHQVGDLSHLASQARTGLWNDPGCGKTFPAQAYLVWLVGYGNKCVAVMPPILCQQFLRSLHNNLSPLPCTVGLFQGEIDERNELIDKWDAEGWPDILIMSNKMFAGKSDAEMRKIKRERERKGKEITVADCFSYQMLLARGYTALLIDEAISVKKASSKLHQAADKFAGESGAGSNGLVLMTGSPVETSLTDVYGLIRLITPGVYRSMRHFESLHCLFSGNAQFKRLVGFCNTELAYENLYKQGRRVTKREATDLPPRVIAEIQVRLSRQHKALYDKLVDERVLTLGDKVIDATVASSLYIKMQRILLAPNQFTLTPIKENALLTAMDELVHSVLPNKIIICCWFNESVEEVARRYAKHNPVKIYGEVVGLARERAKRTFIESSECKIAVINVASGGVGIDGWQAVCSHLLFADICSRPGLFEQAIGRLDRVGQVKECTNIYLLVALQTIAVKLRNDLISRDRMANSVVRDKRAILSDLMGAEGLQGHFV